MGLKDRILNLVASLFAPTMDHPAGGGMTGSEDDSDSPDGGGENEGSDGVESGDES